VERGEINVEELVSREKLIIIEPVVNEFAGSPITFLREKLKSSVSFGEIKLTIAWQKHKNSTGSVK
jgi:hypothetical protein